MTPTAGQLRHACALVRWSPLMLVWDAKVSNESARKVCSGRWVDTVPAEHLQAMQRALEAAGVMFGEDGQARLAKGDPPC